MGVDWLGGVVGWAGGVVRVAVGAGEALTNGIVPPSVMGTSPSQPIGLDGGRDALVAVMSFGTQEI